MARSGALLNPNIPKFDSNSGEAKLSDDVVNGYVFDGIRFEESSAVFKDYILGQMIVLPGLCERISNVLLLVWHYIHYSCSICGCVTSITY